MKKGYVNYVMTINSYVSAEQIGR